VLETKNEFIVNRAAGHTTTGWESRMTLAELLTNFIKSPVVIL
jgi:hypothetical protein